MIFGDFGGGRTRKSFGKKEREALFLSQGGRCMYCGKKEREVTYFDVDHKTPFSRNGRDTFANLQLLCRPCNTRKGDMTDGEFRKAYGLTAASKAKNPPTKVIPQSYFEKISKSRAAKKKRSTRSRTNDFWW
ncbi:MAG: HNH endonuclease [Dehalococcoidia bacterium]|nr:HNH endonuclease [Dehalococcoidia bacterium]